MFPRVKRFNNEYHDEVSVKFYDKKQAVEIDKTRCIGCGLCIKACPKQVMYSKLTQGKIKVKTEDLTPEITNPLDCSYCGTCSYICPVSAILLKYNNRYVRKQDLGIVANKVVPNLDFQCVEFTNPQTKSKSFLEGQIEVDWDKCISCMSCVEVCPTKSFSKTKDNTEKRPKPTLNQDTCTKCGACQRACSKSAIKITVDKIRFSGPYKEFFWNPLVERIRTVKETTA